MEVDLELDLPLYPEADVLLTGDDEIPEAIGVANLHVIDRSGLDDLVGSLRLTCTDHNQCGGGLEEKRPNFHVLTSKPRSRGRPFLGAPGAPPVLSSVR